MTEHSSDNVRLRPNILQKQDVGVFPMVQVAHHLPSKSDAFGGSVGGCFRFTIRISPMLTDLACRSLISAAKHQGKAIKKADKEGLYLLAKPSGEGYWYYKYRISGSEKKIGFGPYSKVPLRIARDRHSQAYKEVLNGIDPSLKRQESQRQAKRDNINTLQALGMAWFNHTKGRWSANHAQTVLRRLQKDLFATLGHQPANSIKPLMLLAALKKIEERGSNEIARRNLQYAKNIFAFGKLNELIDRNPALDLDGALQPFQRGFFPSMTLEELPTFLQKLERNEACLSVDTREAMELLMLTLLRTSELVAVEWKDFHEQQKKLVIPGAKMKRKTGCPIPQDHIVPLSSQAMKIFLERKKRSALLEPNRQSKFVFPSNNKGPLMHMHKRTIGKALFRMDYQGVHTGHGFRALGMGIAKEKLNYAHDIVDRQLAHVPVDELKRSYDRAKYLPQRIEMMQKIANYIDQQKPGSKMGLSFKIDMTTSYIQPVSLLVSYCR